MRLLSCCSLKELAGSNDADSEISAVDGQVHCVWTASTKAKRTAAPEPFAVSLLERRVAAVPTTLATVVKREEAKARRHHTWGSSYPQPTYA